MTSHSINNYPDYIINGGLNFSDYYNPANRNQTPEVLTSYILENITDNIKTIIDVGCACGKNFIPFADSFNCIGFDRAPADVIKWVCDTDNLTYYECSIEDFIDHIDEFDIDWENSLVFTHGTLMYASHENQNRFVEAVLRKGCRNLTLQEYEPGNSGPHPYFNLNETNLKLFEKKMLRDSFAGNPTAHIILNKK